MTSVSRYFASAVLAGFVLAALLAPVLAPHDPREQFADFPYAPPMRPHVFDDGWRPHLPFVYPIHLADRLERRYLEDRTTRIPVFGEPGTGEPGTVEPGTPEPGTPEPGTPEPGTVEPGTPEPGTPEPGTPEPGTRNLEPGTRKPVFLLGTDPLGRDIFSRLLYGARASLGIALVATLGALALGTMAGAAAGYAGGLVDEAAMRAADVVLVLPAIYVALALRAAMPLVLSAGEVFAGLSIVLALVGWPMVARGVRAIVATENAREYAEAARAAGAGPARVLLVHLLPAARGFIATQAALLVPAFVLAEATLSFAGFGFAEPIPSWGTMLQEAGSTRAFGEFPWLLTPAAAIAIVSLAVNVLISKTYAEARAGQF